MQGSVGKNDLRLVKTARVLDAAMLALLQRNDFRKITVRNICEEAQISRATFYARFADKYDFLKSWLITFRPDGISKDGTYEETEKTLNDFIYENKAVIKNIICNADSETLEILSDFVLSVFKITEERDVRKMLPGQIVLSNFFAGGIIFYFQWQVKNKIPSDTIPINIYLRAIVKKLKELDVDSL